MDGVLPQIKHGVSVAGGIRSYVLFKALNRGGHLAYDLQSILSVLYNLNSAGCNTEMHNIRILTEVASTLDMKSLEHLVSYAEFLDNKNQERIGESYQHPYAVTFNAHEQAGLNDGAGLFLRSMGIEVELSSSAERIITLTPGAGTDFLRW